MSSIPYFLDHFGPLNSSRNNSCLGLKCALHRIDRAWLCNPARSIRGQPLYNVPLRTAKLNGIAATAATAGVIAEALAAQLNTVCRT